MIKLIAVGDINIGSDKSFIQKINYNLDLSKNFKNADICFANLEGPITNAGYEPINGDFGLYSEFGVLKFLKNFGINLVSLSNNHISDYGPICVEFTVDFLKENKINYFGWGKNIYDILEPNIIEINGLKLGLIAFTFHDNKPATTNMPGSLPNEPNYFLPLIKKTRENCDVFICSIHWGFEMYSYPKIEDRRFAKYLIDNGVDLILGHHPHVIQGYELYKGKYIFYSLGNFVFKSFWYKGNKKLQPEESKKTMYVEFQIDNSGVNSFTINPIYYNEDLSINIVEGEEKEKFIQYFNRISNDLNRKNYNSFFYKYRIKNELTISNKLKEIFKNKEFNFSIIIKFFKFLKKFIKVVILKK